MASATGTPLTESSRNSIVTTYFSFSQRPGLVEAKDVHRQPIKETTNLNILTKMR